MNQNNTNYSSKKINKKKLIVIIMLFVSVALIALGTVFAYFSDVFTQSGQARTNTLKIGGKYTFYLNGAETQLDAITALNPGDVIVVKGEITNSGAQSAWIRQKISFADVDATFLNFIKVYNGEFTSADLISENAQEDNRINTIEGDAFVSGSNVINGLGTDARTESTGDFDYLDSTIYSPVLTIYFMHKAPNETQNTTFSMSLTTQALQFVNNNIEEPSTDAWASVQAVEIQS